MKKKKKKKNLERASRWGIIWASEEDCGVCLLVGLESTELSLALAVYMVLLFR